MSTEDKQDTSPYQGYTRNQALAYVNARGSYPELLYSLVLSQHTSTGGLKGHILDVGTGPGNGLRPLARSFARATGLDASAGMVAKAREIGGTTSTGDPVDFVVGSVEDLMRNQANLQLRRRSIDMIISANAVHWFDMEQFWTAAASLLRPGGTVALWTLCRPYVHPVTPNADVIQAALTTLDQTLDPYRLGPNRLAYNMYTDLPLPWDVKLTAVCGFDPASLARWEWNRDGVLEDGQDDFFMSRTTMTIAQFEAGLLTSSPSQRWREAHQDLAGTEAEPVSVAMKAIREALKAAGKGEESEGFKGGFSSVLLMIKKI